MLRTPIAICGGTLLLAIVATAPVRADEWPLRKAGYWETKFAAMKDGPPGVAGRAVSHECVDAATNAEMLTKGGMRDLRKTENGYAAKVGSMNFELAGDFNSTYTMKSDTGLALEANWLGDCPTDWKPGDVQIVGGEKKNAMGAAK